MIRSSSHSLKFCNVRKYTEFLSLIKEFRQLLADIIDDIWENGYKTFDISRGKLDIPKFISTQKLKTYETWLSARMRQVAGKQAIAMISAAIEKRKKQLFVLKKKHKAQEKATYLQSKIDRQPLVKPSCENANIELDSRFVDFEKQSASSPFIFIKISSFGKRKQIKVPIKLTAVSNKWEKRGQRKPCLRLCSDNITLLYDIEETKRDGSKVVGADQGISTILSLSDGQATKQSCIHGHTLSSIQLKLSRKKKGSKSFGRAQKHRKNFINWSLNQLNFKNIKELRLEKLKNVGHGIRKSRFLSHWKYTLIKEKLIRLSEVEGFELREVSNEFRSQRCSQCGWVRKANRKGKMFMCSSCGFKHDADMNAASNLELDLFEVPFWVRLKKMNKEGFFWRPNGLFSLSQEPIVPGALEHSSMVE
jgi:transposase